MFVWGFWVCIKKEKDNKYKSLKYVIFFMCIIEEYCFEFMCILIDFFIDIK